MHLIWVHTPLKEAFLRGHQKWLHKKIDNDLSVLLILKATFEI